MDINKITIKSLIIGIIISVTFVIIGHQFDWAYAFAGVGFLYIGYNSENIKNGTLLGLISAIPIMILSFYGYLGEFSGFFSTTSGIIILEICVLLLGAFIGFIGAFAKKNRQKAKKEYEKKQKIGKNKKKKK